MDNSRLRILATNSKGAGAEFSHLLIDVEPSVVT